MVTETKIIHEVAKRGGGEREGGKEKEIKRGR